MENQAYYMRDARSDNRCDLSVSLAVNCAGYVQLTYPFTTNSRRKDWYLQIVDRGQLHDRNGQKIKPMQFILRSPEKDYHYSFSGEAALGYYWIHFTGADAEKLLAENRIPTDRVCTIGAEFMPGIGQVFYRLFREFILRRPGFSYMAASLLTDILVRLSRSILADTSEDAESPLRRRLEQSATFIHSRFHEQLDIHTLALRENLSDSRYRELFREAFGMPPGEYITRQRISHACSLLQSTNLSVGQIAEACGYQDTLYFSRIFRKKMGVSPLGYRKDVDVKYT